jgi:hypothetical protein
MKISEVVQEALENSYLTLEAEEQLRLLLRGKYDLEDFTAFMNLQKSVFAGEVTQESRELFSNRVTCKAS